MRIERDRTFYIPGGIARIKYIHDETFNGNKKPAETEPTNATEYSNELPPESED